MMVAGFYLGGLRYQCLFLGITATQCLPDNSHGATENSDPTEPVTLVTTAAEEYQEVTILDSAVETKSSPVVLAETEESAPQDSEFVQIKTSQFSPQPQVQTLALRNLTAVKPLHCWLLTIRNCNRTNNAA